MSELIKDWKDDQKDVLEAEGDLLLTASAGTGKTTVLIEKFARTLIEQIEESGSTNPLQNLLAITFTDLAAAEMKNKLRKRLEAEKHNPDRTISLKLLAELIRELDGAWISTIHSFCIRILREHFVEARLSPGFSVLAEDEAKDLAEQSAEKAIRRYLGTHLSGPLHNIAMHLGNEQLRTAVMSIAERLRSDGVEMPSNEELLDPFVEKWKEEARRCCRALNHTWNSLAEAVRQWHTEHSATKSSQTSLDWINEVDVRLQPVFDNPDCLLDDPEIAAILLEKKVSTRGAFGEIAKPLREALFELVQEGSGDGVPPLSFVAGSNAYLPAIREFIELLAMYFRLYAEEKEKRDTIDFDDQLLKARALLKDNPDVLRRYRDQFSHLFVDEFQDVNEVQLDIVTMLRGFEEEADRSILIVGDGKQSIYRFRYADVLRYGQFADTLLAGGATELPLKSNFRSDPALIDTFNRLFPVLFTENGSPYRVPYTPVIAQRKRDDPGADHPRTVLLQLSSKNSRHEAQVIANSIRELVKPPFERRLAPGGREFGYGDMALLLRKFTGLQDYEIELQRAAIPYAVVSGRGLYQQREIWDIIAYLKAVWFPQDSLATTALLRSPLCLLSDETLLHFGQKNLLRAGTALAGKPDIPMTPEEEQRFSRLLELMIRHRNQRDALSSADMITELLEITGYHAFVLSQEAGDQSGANLRKLIELARRFEATGTQGGPQFILDLERRMYSDESESQATIGDIGNRVRLLTVHKAKGLEFPVVFLPGLAGGGAPGNDPINYDRRTGIGIRSYSDAGKSDNSPQLERIRKQSAREEAEELRRLLYVAMTRTKELLILPRVSEDAKENGKPVRISHDSWHNCLKECIAGVDAGEAGLETIEEDAYTGVAEKPASPAEMWTPGSPNPEVPQVTDNAIVALARRATSDRAGRLHTYACSTWQLIPLISPETDAPEVSEELKRQQQSLDEAEKKESNGSEAREMGLAVHKALEYLHGQNADSVQLDKTLRSCGVSTSDMEYVRAGLAAWFSDDLYQRIAQQKYQAEAPFLTYLRQGDMELELSGVIDLLVQGADGPIIIDYKFGEQKDVYALQLQLYALALNAMKGAQPVQEAHLVYLKGEMKTVYIDVSLPALERTLEQAFAALTRGQA